MELTSITQEHTLWKVEFQLNGDGHSRYSYYSRDKFRDELDIYIWWKEQTDATQGN